MDLELKELAIGAALGIVTLIAFRVGGIHRERGTYAVLLVAITVPYIISAIETHETDTMYHAGFAVMFAAIALIGARLNLWLVVLGLLGHAIFDGMHHYTGIIAPTPGWYGPVCLGFDLSVAAGLAGFLLQGHTPRNMS